MKKLIVILCMVCLSMVSAWAQDQVEQPVSTEELDARAKEVALTLRCVVCKNQSIAESDAQLAKDLRALVRERLEAGDTNEEARTYVVSRYGEFVLLKPTFSLKNLGLWLGPFFVLGLALFGGFMFIISRRNVPAGHSSLTEQERDELERFLGHGDGEE